MRANLSIFAIWMAPHCSKRAETRYWKKKKSCKFAIHNMVLARFLFYLMADLMHHSFIFNMAENDTSPRNFITSTLLVMIIYDAHYKFSIISNLGTSFHVSRTQYLGIPITKSPTNLILKNNFIIISIKALLLS